MLIFGTDDLLEEPNERDHDDSGEDAEGEGLEEGAQVQHHRQQHQGRHQARQQRPDQCTVLIIYLDFFFYVRYSRLLHLMPLRFHCVGGCWDPTQASCDYTAWAVRRSNHSAIDLIHNRLDLIHTRLDLIH
jgi:hypothetical protein